VAVKTRQPRGRGRGQLRFVNTLLDREWTDPLPIWAWVIEHPAGLLIIDTGETSRAGEPGYFPRWHQY
jgi:N-acyl homoserine lactone hydrolase